MGAVGKKKPIITHEVNERIIALRNGGATCQQIALALKLTPSCIARRLQRPENAARLTFRGDFGHIGRRRARKNSFMNGWDKHIDDDFDNP